MLYVFDRAKNFVCSFALDKKRIFVTEAIIDQAANGAYTLEFTMPADNDNAKEVEELYYVAVPHVNNVDYDLFLITEISSIHAGGTEIRFFCEHASKELGDTFKESIFIDRKTAAQALPDIVAGTGWTIGNIEATTEQHSLENRRTNSLALLQQFAETWGGILSYRVVIQGNTITSQLLDYSLETTFSGKRFVYDKDLEEITRTIDASGVKTALYGYGKETARDENDTPIVLDFSGVEWFTEAASANLLTANQSNAETDGTGVTVAGTGSTFLRPSSLSWEGGYCFQLKNNGAAAYNEAIQTSTLRTTVTAGQTYTASIYGRHDAATNININVRINWRDAGGNQISEVSAANYSAPPNQWQRYTHTAAAPANAVSCYIRLYATSLPAGASLFADGLQLEALDVATSFMTGGTSRNGSKPVDKAKGVLYVEDAAALAKYGRNGAHLFGVFHYETEDPETLLQKTWEALQAAKVPKINYSAKVVDLYRLYGWGYEMITAGKIAHVIDNDLDIEAAARIMRYKRDLINREASEIELGAFLEVLSDNMEKLRAEIDNVKQTIPAPIDTSAFVTADPPQTSSRYTEAMRKLQDALFTAGGTVTFTETEGIMITDLPLDQNPTKALRLKGGIFSLGVWNTALNSWDWRTFGDANGFTANEITAGTMSFDRAKGGTVTLGGALVGTTETGAALYENGILEVYDNEGNKIVTLDGQQGGFNRLFVGELSGNNVVLKTTAPVTYYVDHVAGNDDNNGLTTATAYKSIQTAINKLPKYLEHDITIEVQGTGRTYSEPNLVINGFCGIGFLKIALGSNNTLKGEITISNTSTGIIITTVSTGVVTSNKATILNQNVTGWLGAVVIQRCVHVQLWSVIINANNLCQYNLQVKHGSYAKIEGNEHYNASYACIAVEDGSHASIVNEIGQSARGLFAYTSSIIAGYGKAPKGTALNTETRYGAYLSATFTHDAGSAKPVYTPSTTTIWTPNDTHSWTSNTGWTSDYVYNGKRPGDPPWWYGFIFFNAANFGALKNPDGTNRPITRVRLFVQRTNNTGENTSRKPQLYCSTQAAASGNGSYYGTASRSDIGFTWGQSGWITLPTSFGQEFQNGTAKSLCMYDGGSEANYCRFEPTGIQLEITHG